MGSGQAKEEISIVFVDVDGVLNCTETNGCIDDDKLILLKEIINATNAKIVISSSWRNTTKKLNKLSNALHRHGIEYIDCTPNLLRYRKPEANRVCEIQSYLKSARDKYNIQQWVAIDDYNLIKHSSFFKNHLVNTSVFHGIRKQDVKLAINILTSSK